jgi:hypothetical protein
MPSASENSPFEKTSALRRAAWREKKKFSLTTVDARLESPPSRTGGIKRRLIPKRFPIH